MRNRKQFSRQSTRVHYPVADTWTTWTSVPSIRVKSGEDSTSLDLHFHLPFDENNPKIVMIANMLLHLSTQSRKTQMTSCSG